MLVVASAVTLVAVAVVPAPWQPRVPCVDSTDCANLGVCDKGRCSCDKGWTGPQCQTLDLLPAPNVAAYGADPNISSWGCTVIKVCERLIERHSSTMHD